MAAHIFTYGQYLSVHKGCSRSALARSDTANSTANHVSALRSRLLRPPREDLVSSQQTMIVESRRRRTLSVCTRTTLARSDTANNAAAFLPGTGSMHLLHNDAGSLWRQPVDAIWRGSTLSIHAGQGSSVSE